MSRTHSRLRKFLPLKHDSQLARRTVSQFVQSSPQQRREVQVWKITSAWAAEFEQNKCKVKEGVSRGRAESSLNQKKN